MSDITLTASIRSNLLSLQNTTKLLDSTSTRLSTGKRVNSALDNPNSFFTARGLSNRASDLTARKDSIGQSISLLQATDKSINSITSLVEQAKAVAQQAEEAATGGVSTISSQAAALTGVSTISTESAATAAGSLTTISSAAAAAATGSITAISSEATQQPRAGAVTADVTAAAASVKEVEQITLTGDYKTGDVITVQIDSNTADTYTVNASDIGANQTATLSNVASGLAAVIEAGNGSGTIGATAGASGAVITITADAVNTSFTTTLDAANDVSVIESVATASGGQTGSSLLTSASTFSAVAGNSLTLESAATGGGSSSSTLFTVTATSTIDDLVTAITNLDSNITASFNTLSGEIEIVAQGGMEFTVTDGGSPLTVATTVTQTASTKEVETITLTGDFSNGDVVSVQIDGLDADVYTVNASDIGANATATLANVAAGITAAIEAGTGTGNAAVTSSGAVITITADTVGNALNTSVSQVGAEVTADVTAASTSASEVETITLSGSYIAGDTISATITSAQGTTSTETYTVLAGDVTGNNTANLAAIATAFSAQINSGIGASGSGVASAGSSAAVITITSDYNDLTIVDIANAQTATANASTKEIETITLTGFYQVGDTVSASIDGTVVSYTVDASDIGGNTTATLANVAASFTAEIEGGTGSTAISASSSAGVITLTADSVNVGIAVSAITSTGDASFSTVVSSTSGSTSPQDAFQFASGSGIMTSGVAQTFDLTGGATDLITAAFSSTATATDTLTFSVTGGSGTTNSVTFTVGTNTVADLVTQINDIDSDITASFNTSTSKIDITSGSGGSVLTFAEGDAGVTLAGLGFNDGTADITAAGSKTFATTQSASDTLVSAYAATSTDVLTLSYNGVDTNFSVGNSTIAELVTAISGVDADITASFNTTTFKIDITSGVGGSAFTLTNATGGGDPLTELAFTTNGGSSIVSGTAETFLSTATGSDLLTTAYGASATDVITVSLAGGGSADISVGTKTIDELVTAIAAVDSAITVSFNSSLAKIDISAATGQSLTFTDQTGTGVAALGLENGTTTITSGIATDFIDTSVAVTTGDALTTAYSGVAATDILTIATSNGGSSSFTVGTKTVADLIAAIGNSDSALTASFNTDSKAIEVTAASGTGVTFTNTTGSAVGNLGLTNGTTALTSGAETTYGSSGSAAQVGSLNTDFQSILEQIDTLLSDASYKGANLLSGGNDFVVKFNADGSSSLTLTGLDLGVSDNANLKFTLNSDGYDFTTTGITTALTDTQAAIDHMRSVASTFGTGLGIIQTRESFTTELVNVLQSGSDKLVNANLEEESANMLALQTRQSLGIQSLSIANQSQQSILSLFR